MKLHQMSDSYIYLLGGPRAGEFFAGDAPEWSVPVIVDAQQCEATYKVIGVGHLQFGPRPMIIRAMHEFANRFDAQPIVTFQIEEQLVYQTRELQLVLRTALEEVRRALLQAITELFIDMDVDDPMQRRTGYYLSQGTRPQMYRTALDAER